MRIAILPETRFMTAPALPLIDAIGNFLSTSRDYLGVDCQIRLSWPPRARAFAC